MGRYTDELKAELKTNADKYPGVVAALLGVEQWMGWDIEAWKNDEVLNEPLPPA